MNYLLELENLSYTPESSTFFLEGEKDIIKNISFGITKGSILGVIGESGSGKTTLGKIIAGMIKPTSGRLISALKYSSPNSKNPVQILFQNNEEIINPFRKVKDILFDKTKDKSKSNRLCKLLQISENFMNKRGYQLSGGERQRVALARLLSAEPKLLILDEPFAAQDFESQYNFASLFKKLNVDLDLTVVCISHNIEIIKSLTDDLLILYGGQIMEYGSNEEILRISHHPYTRFLLRAESFQLKRDDFSVENNMESLDHSPCAYYVRCSLRTEKCLTEIEIIKENIITYCNHPIEKD